MNPYDFFKKEEAPLLTRQIDEFSSGDLKGISVTHNTPLLPSALIKLMPFIKNSITLYASTPEHLGYDNRVIDYLRKNKIEFDFSKDKIAKGDIFLDCSANLLHKGNPKAVCELTRTGSIKYRESNLNIPIISVDDSKIKLLEDYLGTGEGFVRAFKETVNTDLVGKHFIIWGYGKVGKGIAKSLTEEGCKCTVIDTNKDVFKFAIKRNIHVVHIDEQSEIRNLIKSGYCLITCTGISGVVSDSVFFEDILNSSLILANMGAEDEYGPRISSNKVLNNKIALNFSGSGPTKLKYLDPIFYAHNHCLKLFSEGKLKKGFSPLSKDLDDEILNEWKNYWKEDISDIFDC